MSSIVESITFQKFYVINDPWRNGSASDSRSEGCVFESRRGQTIFLSRAQNYFTKLHQNANEFGNKAETLLLFRY